jgi:SAM-dependent methyltransferase
METIQFADRKASVAYYQQRYEEGYMGHWSRFEKDRIRNLVRELNLPEHGNALDFGCGRGIFTKVLQEALPGWKITGCDINDEAIASAKKNNAGISFFVLEDVLSGTGKFDFIHSHHVLEHTFDVRVSAEEIAQLGAPHCTMLHCMPCNHPGSLEYKLSSWTKGGIDPVSGKFFFEDTAHLRRQSAAQAEAMFAPFGFSLKKKYFSNQYWGAIKWIAESNLKLASSIAYPFHADSSADFFKLLKYWVMFTFSWICFFAANAFTAGDKGRFYIFRKILQLFFFVALFPIAIPVKMYINRKAEEEWKKNKYEVNGSEMFLVFSR